MSEAAVEFTEADLRQLGFKSPRLWAYNNATLVYGSWFNGNYQLSCRDGRWFYGEVEIPPPPSLRSVQRLIDWVKA